MAPDASETDARGQLAEFMRTASIEGKPRRWMAGDLHRSSYMSQAGVRAEGRAAVAYAYNEGRGGVCAIVAMTEPPFVITVVTRRDSRIGQRARRERLVAERLHGRRGRRARYERRLNEAS